MKKNKDEGMIEIKLNNSMSIKEIMRTFRCLAVIGMTVSILGTLLAVVLGGMLAYASVTSTSEQLQKNKYAITYLSHINNYDESDIVDELNTATSSKSFAFSYAIVPTLIIVGDLVVFGALSIKLHKFVSGVETDEELFNEEKLKRLKEIRKYVLTIGLLIILFYDVSYILIYAFLEAMLELIIYLFNRTIKASN